MQTKSICGFCMLMHRNDFEWKQKQFCLGGYGSGVKSKTEVCRNYKYSYNQKIFAKES